MTTIKNPLKVYQKPALFHPVLLVGWQTQDVGNVGTGTMNYLQEACQAKEVAEVDPLGFFAFEGAIFKNNLIQIPESKFYECAENNLLLLGSDEPMYEKYNFINTTLNYCRDEYMVSRLFTFNGHPSPVTHHGSRSIFLVFNQLKLGEEFPENEQVEHVSWDGPPAMSTYLLWVAQKKGISGITLWVEVPFYLSSIEDPAAIKSIFSFLNAHLDLRIDLSRLNQKIERQNRLLQELCDTNPEVAEKMQKLDQEEELEENEQVFLSKTVYEYLQSRKQ